MRSPDRHVMIGVKEAKKITIIINHSGDGERSGMSTILLVPWSSHRTAPFSHLQPVWGFAWRVNSIAALSSKRK